MLLDPASPEPGERFVPPGRHAVEARAMLVLAASERPEAKARRRRRKA